MNHRLEKYRDLCVALLEDRKRPSEFRTQFIAAYWADRTPWVPAEARALQDLAFILRELDDDFSIRQSAEMSLRSMLLLDEPSWYDKAMARSKVFHVIPGVLSFAVALLTFWAFQAWVTPFSQRLAELEKDSSKTSVECRVQQASGKSLNAGRGGNSADPCDKD